MDEQRGGVECIYLMESSEQARFVGRRLEEAYLPEVLIRLSVFVREDGRVLLAACFSLGVGEQVLGWARSIMSEHGERLDPSETLTQLEGGTSRFAAVYPDRGRGFL